MLSMVYGMNYEYVGDVDTSNQCVTLASWRNFQQS